MIVMMMATAKYDADSPGKDLKLLALILLLSL